MRHLTEEEMIDVLMGDGVGPALKLHLQECPECGDQMQTLERGLSAAQQVKPSMPLSAVPLISYERFYRQRKTSRMTWLAVAAMLLLALMGFRAEIGANGMTVQFALFHATGSQDEQRIAALEERLMQALEVQSAMTQEQLDERFNAFFQDQEGEFGEFTQVVNTNLKTSNLENERKMLQLTDVLVRQDRKNSALGTMR